MAIKEIEQNNFLHIPNFIYPERARELAKEFIRFCKDNNLEGDTQIPESHSAYNYISFLELLCEKTPEVSNFLGEKVLPTYVYARVYKEGSTLIRHRDRHACEVSITLHLTGDSEWPIFIQKPNGEEVALNLGSGDAMMYYGMVADHWRERFQGQEYVQVFLHYVKSRGDNAWAYFDKDKMKGSPEDTRNIMPPKVEEEVKPIEAPAVIKSYKRNIEDYIVTFDNILPPEVCDSIINEYKNSNEWNPTHVGGGVVDRTIRNVDSIGISFKAIIDKNPAVRREIDNQVFNGAAKAIASYNQQFNQARIEQDSGYELLKYDTGFFYTEHTDSFKAAPRSVSCSFSLNDDYEGGEFAFFDKQLKFRAKKGSVIMFPSNFMYPHEILPVTSGTRYSIITWFI